MRQKSTSGAFLSVSLLTVGFTTAAWAQEATTDQLATVTVTANRRAESNQTVPIAVSAVTEETLTKFNVPSLQTLDQFVPGAVFNRQSNGSIPFIRGVGNPNSTAGDEPSVATFIDDVYMPFPGSGVANYNSISRIEVLKGPQGTLFGRNATGGVIMISTRNPTDAPSLETTVGYANYNTPSASIYATGKLFDGVSGNIALYGGKQYDGWGHNLVTGSESFTGHYYGGRAKLLWAPSESTSALLTLVHDTVVSEEGLNYRGAPGTKTQGGVPAPEGWFDYFSDVDDSSHFWTNGASLKVTHDSSWSKFVSITAFNHSENPANYNLTLGPGPNFTPVHIVGKDSTWTQEFRLLAPDASSIKWAAGLFFMNDTAKYNPLTIANILNNNGTQVTNSYAGFADAAFPIASATHLTAGVRYTEDKRDANVNFNIGPIPPFPNCPPGGQPPDNCLAVPGTGGTGSATFSDWSGRLSLDHQFTQDFMAYAAYNRGFKSGLFNLVAVLSPLNPVVKPETLDAFSVGEKAEFLERRLRFNTDVFYYKYKNIQVQEVKSVPGGGFTSFTTNAAAATIKGIDVDIQAIPFEHFILTAALEALDGKFDDFPNGAFNVYQPVLGGNCALAPPPGNCGLTPGSPGAPPNYDGTNWNLKGNKTPNSPPFSSTLTGDYTIPSTVGSFNVSVSWNYTGNYFFQADNGQGQIPPSSPSNAKQATLNLFNASVSWQSRDGGWNVNLWGRNLSNVHYVSFGFETSPATQITGAPPRTYGVQIRKIFQ
jgi:iron complex outermembrane receptor protein